MLGKLAQLDNADYSQLLETARSSWDESRFTKLATLPHADWTSHLHLLAHRQRADLMQDLAVEVIKK
jgi:hypothetical protein